MSAMSTQRRKLFIDRKPKLDRTYVKGDYQKWLTNAKAQLAALFKVDGYLKHRTHARDVFKAINRERNAAEDAALKAA